MTIFPRPRHRAVERLLAASDLPTADLTPAHLEHFLGAGPPDALDGVVGLELGGDVALLRSLAVAPARRGGGLGAALVAAAERHAREGGVRSLYLLTTTAEAFFARLGYVRATRESAPAAIRATREFAGLCPVTSVFMTKALAPDVPGGAPRADAARG